MTKLLVVEDSAVDRRLVGELLKRRVECMIEYAASGEEAMARMLKISPDLVLTDLTMPGMDGLQLVKSLRTHYPGVPVILMTAYGNEALAMTALEQGAASYVPKSHLPAKLADTVEEVLELARADRSHYRLIQCLTETRFVFTLENDAALIDPLVDLVQQMVTGIELVDFTGRLQIGVALKQRCSTPCSTATFRLPRMSWTMWRVICFRRTSRAWWSGERPSRRIATAGSTLRSI